MNAAVHHLSQSETERLADEFAGQAMAAIVAGGVNPRTNERAIAVQAYRLADEMIAVKRERAGR